MGDRDRANENEIEIFVFSVTSNDFPHDMTLTHSCVEYQLKNAVHKASKLWHVRGSETAVSAEGRTAAQVTSS